MQRLHFPVGALLGDAVPDLALDLLEGALLAGHDLADAHQHDGELALDRLGQLVLLQAEGGIGDLGVDHVLAREQAEVDIALLEPELGGGFLEVLGLGELRVGLLRRRLVREGELLDAPLLGDVELLLVLLVGGLDVSSSLTASRALTSSRVSSSTLILRSSGVTNWRLFCS